MSRPRRRGCLLSAVGVYVQAEYSPWTFSCRRSKPESEKGTRLKSDVKRSVLLFTTQSSHQMPKRASLRQEALRNKQDASFSNLGFNCVSSHLSCTDGCSNSGPGSLRTSMPGLAKPFICATKNRIQFRLGNGPYSLKISAGRDEIPIATIVSSHHRESIELNL